MHIPVLIDTCYYMVDKKALVDSGATDNFINPVFTKHLGLRLQELEASKKIFNIDNTTNKSGSITHFLNLKVCTKGQVMELCFLVADIGSKDLLLGYPWLVAFEPKFDWKHATMDWGMMPVVISSTILLPTKTILATMFTQEKKWT